MGTPWSGLDRTHFDQHLVGCLEGVKPGWNAAVDGRMQEDFPDFLGGKAVVDRPRTCNLISAALSVVRDFGITGGVS